LGLDVNKTKFDGIFANASQFDLLTSTTQPIPGFGIM